MVGGTEVADRLGGMLPRGFERVVRGVARRAWPFVPAGLRRAPALQPLRRVIFREARPRRLRSLAELDGVLVEIDHASHEDAKRTFATFVMKVRRPRGLDPFSDAYKARELGIYEWISGRIYRAQNETTVFDLSDATRRPYPYLTGNAATVGDQLMGIGFLIKAMNLPAPGRVLE